MALPRFSTKTNHHYTNDNYRNAEHIDGASIEITNDEKKRQKSGPRSRTPCPCLDSDESVLRN